MRPRSSTMIWSASRTVDSRWAMTIVVRPSGERVERLLHLRAPSRRRARWLPRRAPAPAGCAGSSARSRGAAARRPRTGSRARRRRCRSPPAGAASMSWMLRRAGGVLELLVGRVGPGEAQVLADGGVEQVRLLRHHPDHARAGRRAAGRARRRRRSDAARLRVVQARDQIAERRLAAARLADDGHLGARLGRERDVGERGLAVLVGERRRGRTRPRRGPSAAGTGCSGSAMSTGWSRYSKMRSNRASEVCTSACTPSRLPTGKNRRVCRVVNATRVPIETVAMPDAIAWPANQVDQRRHDGERGLQRRHHPAAGHALADLQVGQQP